MYTSQMPSQKTSITRLTYENFKSKKEEKQEWMTDEILKMMEERRKLKDRNVNEYNKLHKNLIWKRKEAKKIWLTGKCVEIETFQQNHDHLNMHKQIKEIQNSSKQRNTGIILDSEGQILIRVEPRLEWKKYTQELFDDTIKNTTRNKQPLWSRNNK